MVGRDSKSLLLRSHQCFKLIQCFVVLMLVFTKEGEPPLQPIYSVTLVREVHLMDLTFLIIHKNVIVMLHEEILFTEKETTISVKRAL